MNRVRFLNFEVFYVTKKWNAESGASGTKTVIPTTNWPNVNVCFYYHSDLQIAVTELIV